jgi:hypothetical protein
MTHRLRRSGTGDRLLEAVALQAQELQGENADLRAERDAALANLAAARAREKRKDELLAKAMMVAARFVAKVESNRARSVETYADCKALLASIRAEIAGEDGKEER